MNFSRNLEAFRQYGAATDGTTSFADWVSANTLVQDNFGDGAGDLIRIEGERTCHVIQNRNLTAAGWGVATFGTISRTQNASTWGAVDGNTTSGTRITIPAGAPGGWGYSQNLAGLLTNPHRISCWIRGHSVGGTLRTNYDALITGISIAGTTWQRVQRASTSTGAAWYPADSTANVGDAQDWYFDLMQAESIGATEPIGISSPVRTTTVTITRPKDDLTAIPENFPIWMLKRGKIPYISPNWSSADQIDGMIAWVVCWTAGDGIYGIRFNRDATDLRLEVLAAGVVKARSSALTFAAHDLLENIVWDSIAGTLTVDGVAGTTSIWNWTLPSSDWRVGGVPSSSGELFGRISPVWSEPIEPSIRISGTVTIGGILTSNDIGIVTSKQWQRGNIVDGIGTYSACGGSDSGDTYTVVADDIGYSIRCVATGPGGTTNSNALTWVGIAASLASATSVFDETNQTGSPVNTWSASVGSLSFSQATGFAQPAAGRTVNGYAALDFDGVNDLMGSATAPIDFIGATYEGWLVFVADAITSTGADIRQNHMLMGSNADVFWAVLKDFAGVKKMSFGHYDGGLPTVSDTVTVGATTVANFSYDGSRLRLKIDGNSDVTQTGVGTAIGLGGTVMTLGNTTYGGVYFNGALACVVTCNAEQSSTVRADVHAYLRNKYQ
jgi:hypothetical protein